MTALADPNPGAVPPPVPQRPDLSAADRSAGPRSAPRGRPGYATLLRELRDDMILLAKQEFALAKTETSRNAATIASNAAKAVAYGALALVGVLLILVGLSFALGWLFTEAGMLAVPAIACGFLVFGAFVTIVFAVLLYGATKTLREANALPQRSLDSLNADANLAARAASGR
ncbi:phage holin family protein [Phycisphaera mikurensis]|uniref:Phage holin family protein n=1 Tax=Phycisphaera mikurensis (strain NBRC 102666 / KCTC 22515 / FYK2301M01) TaxID=1142394 RepID=I0IFD7_PHYMF|nr:phage holin family protein [Phycisphaera mikurensis]MBB6440632.1 hypothetical protein [Phycisphaera mikurensis]BAM03975.1 hypothetical protein PSMK_18160 [Phycisphaera mikurensis NBRC 102666]